MISQKAKLRTPIAIALLFLLVSCQTAPASQIDAPTTPIKSASWSEQLSVVQKEIDRLDRNAVITVINADLDSCARMAQSAYTSRFTAMRSDGGFIEIAVNDESVANVVWVNQHFGAPSDSPSLGELQRIGEAIKSVRIGPRDACLKTVDEGKAFLGATGSLSQRVTMVLAFDQQETFGIPAVYEVAYSDFGDMARREDDRVLQLLVSPIDGSVLRRIINHDVVSTPTATSRMLPQLEVAVVDRSDQPTE
jgi:hypothetical protein